MGDAAPQHIGSFAIIRLLHDGPDGSVYLGKHQVRTKNYITIHVYPLPLTTDEAREAFLTRAKSLKKLKHRNIAEVVDYGLLADEANGEQQSPQGYLVMQYVTGKSIREHFPAGQCQKPDEVKRILSPIADALQYAHTMHIQHGARTARPLLAYPPLRIRVPTRIDGFFWTARQCTSTTATFDL